MNSNICRFIPPQNTTEPIRILHFVLETQAQPAIPRTDAHYTVYLVLTGSGSLQGPAGSRALRPGDLFFTLPAVPYWLQSGPELRYIYISYMGTRANALMAQLRITRQNNVFAGYKHLAPLWRSGLEVNEQLTGLRSESILMYTLSELGRRLYADEAALQQDQDAALQIKKYVDDHFADPALSLASLGGLFSYNPKYISNLFKQNFKVNFSDYLNELRIRQACALMQQSVTCVKDVAALCGFRDPMYFSRVFKERVGLSPREWRRSQE